VHDDGANDFLLVDDGDVPVIVVVVVVAVIAAVVSVVVLILIVVVIVIVVVGVIASVVVGWRTEVVGRWTEEIDVPVVIAG